MSRAERVRRPAVVASKAVAGVFEALSDSLHAAFSKPDIKIEDRHMPASYLSAGVRWAELVACKALLAAFVLAMGNANPTIRQLLDSVRP